MNKERPTSWEEDWFQEAEFDSKRKVLFALSGPLVPMLFFTHFGAGHPFLRDVETDSWYLNHYRLLQGFYWLILGVVSGTSSNRIPTFRAFLRANKLAFYIGFIWLWIIGELVFLALLESEIGDLPPDDRCGNPIFFIVFCPTPIWSLLAISVRVAWYYVMNMTVDIPLRVCVVNSLAYSTILFLTLVPRGPFADYVVSSSDYWDPRLCIGPLVCTMHMVISLVLHAQSKEDRFQRLLSTRRLMQYRTTNKRVLETMIPERLVREVVSSAPRATGFPRVIMEDFDNLTVMFCKFNDTDILHIASADTFLRLVAKSVDMFDEIVHQTKLCKVEHIGTDYVVTSSNMNGGQISRSREEGASLVLKVAAKLVKTGNDLRLEGSEACLHFRAGVHSGDVIGAVAGKTRRFYRLFGDTVNTTARMAQLAPPGMVQASSTTKKLADTDKSLKFEGREVHVKGKGTMQVYLSSHLEPLKRLDSRGNSMRKSTVQVERTDSFWKRANTFAIRTPKLSEFNAKTSIKPFEQVLSVLAESTKSKDAPSDIEFGPIPGFVQTSADSPEPDSWVRVVRESILRVSTVRVSTARESNARQSKRSSGRTSQSTSSQRFSWRASNSMTFNRIMDVRDVSEENMPLNFFGTFHEADMEERFLQSMLAYETQRTKYHFAAMAVCQAIFFGSLFSAVDYSGNIEAWSVGCIGSVAVLVPSALLVLIHFWGLQCTLLISRMALGVNFASAMSIITICKTPFVWCSLNFLIVMSHYREHPIGALVIPFVGIVLAVFLMFMAGHVPSEYERSIPMLYIPVVLSVIFGVSRLLHCREIRYSWIVEQKLALEGRQLDAVMKDLIPSSEGQHFIQTRYMQIAHREVPQDGAVLAGVCCLDSPSHAAVLSSDLVGFTAMCSNLHPCHVVEILHELWCISGTIVEPCLKSQPLQSRPFKMDTIGDAYIVVCKIPEGALSKAIVSDMMILASEIMNAIHHFNDEANIGNNACTVQMRMGLAIGEILSGVVGYLQPRYHVYGEAVQLSAFMESQSNPSCLKLSEDIVSLFGLERSVYCLIDSMSSSNTPYLDTTSLHERMDEDCKSTKHCFVRNIANGQLQ